MKYKSNRNITYSCKYHVVWCPKYRRSVLIDGVDVRLKELLVEKCAEHQAEIIELEVMPDHVLERKQKLLALKNPGHRITVKV